MKMFLILSFFLMIPSQTQADALLGIYYGNQGWDMKSVRDIETWQGKKHAVVKLFTDWSPANKANLFEHQLPAVWNNGSIPIINWELYTDANTSKNILAQVAQGHHDRYLESWMRKLKRFLAGKDNLYGNQDDRRVYLQFAHEMNSDWYLWSDDPINYVKTWRYLHQKFTSQGFDASHVQWVWCVNNIDKSDAKAESYYPGDAYVDWVGINGYNWGEQGKAHHWESVEDVFEKMRQRMLKFKKPMLISEVGSSSHVNGGHSLTKKSVWIQSFFNYVQQHDIGMVIWFNEDKDSDWGIYAGKYGTAKDQQHRYYYQTYRDAIANSKLLSANANHPRLLSDENFKGVRQQSTETVNLDVVAKQNTSMIRSKSLAKTLIMPSVDTDPYVELQLHHKKNWHGGYCATAELISHAQVNDWQIELALTGPLMGVWAAQFQSKKDFRVKIWPNEWNTTLLKGERVQFEFCAQGQLKDVVIAQLQSRPFQWKSYYDLPPLQIKQTFTSIWKGGYCVEFHLKNTSQQTVRWKKLHFRFANSRLKSHWNGKFLANQNHLNIQSEAWNQDIKADQKKDLGFCADGINQILLDKVVFY
ncbi:MAG: cellulose binding domain-containing protein [Mariprofundaceae bacterium]|nr:cellulose binding domain-containing protein [Mariprofundaceae bacterium]